MRLTPPKKVVFIIALVLAVVALLATLLPTVVVLSAIAPYAFWVALAAWALLAAGNYFKGF